jgi:hypothetical protein
MTGVNNNMSAKAVKNDWPFTIELVPVSKLTVDLSYQRPPQEKFVEKIISEFDETLVGALDVSERLLSGVSQRVSNGTYAILDGAQRFQAIQKFKGTAWCAIYKGMTIADEAMFFYLKNRNRRSVHPYYQFRALIVTGDKQAVAINRIVTSESYKLGIGGIPDDTITAVRAVEEAFNMSSVVRKESLSAALRTMRACFHGRKGGKEGELIKGLGRFFQPFDNNEVDLEWLFSRLADQNPQVLLGRASDKADVTRHPRAYWLARDIVDIYNRGRKAGHRLQPRFIEGKNN